MARAPRPVRGQSVQRQAVAAAMADTGAQPDQPGTEDQRAIAEKARADRFQRLAETLVKYRKEAIDGRASSGIEDIWREDEEHYEGIDERNRGTSADTTKPPGRVNETDDGDESIEFPNITRPYVDAAAAKVGDILLPTDDRAWSIKETPIPELIKRAKQGGLPVEVVEGMAQLGVSEATAKEVVLSEQAQAQATLDEAREKAKRAQTRIEDWHVESQFHGEMRKVIDSACKVGTGVLKGPMPVVKRQQMYRGGALIIEEVRKPVSREVDVWNCFPDPVCGNSIHNGRFHFECDFITSKQLEMLKMDDDYLGGQIDLCLLEGPKKITGQRRLADGRYLDDNKLFQIWYVYVNVPREDLEAAGVPMKGDGPGSVPACFTMVNDRVIKGALNHLDTGEFPYDYFPWQRRKNSPWGTGVSRQIRTAQRIVVAATRVMLTNAGRAAGPLIIMKSTVKGANGRNDITSWKVYYAGKDDDVSKAFAVIEMPDRQASLMAIIQFGFKLAEDITGLPLLLQGQAGAAPETLGGQQLVDRNASGVLRRIARTIDDTITEPHIRRYYAYLLLYGEDDFEKGEFVIDARGSTALVDRELYKQETEALLQASLNPAFGLSPKKAMTEYLRSRNRNPKDLQYTEEEQKQIEQQQSQQQPDPRAEASKEVAQIRGQADVQKAEISAQADQAEMRFRQSEAAKDRAHAREMKTMDYNMKLMEFAQQRNMSIDELKVDLARDTMKINAQVRLSREKNAAAPQVATPAVEPPGRAKPGQAFQA